MRETLKIKLILCPIDFSDFSVSAYQHALSVARHYQAKLVAQHIVELWRHPSVDFAASAGLYEEALQGASRQRRGATAGIRQEAHP
jgi:Universal stress protein family